ncbi:hypothetical protein EA462_04820 [Natrarchaeobius halalkaliphilus]|uniref:Uncharacterized protein n=1 Tax=Natrarchaeobius halalkaliphilus TaxID=1679091 RepID=A0A3N6M7J6_9EURY|nr:hypothetical protein [Natrarchaeobius halalkaliphilus]RQG91311.1 hypothetical protein EA462_04820 [Natrarchaeobius halalkaliphilus]
MSDLAALLFNAFLVVQVPIALLVYVDARRLALENPLVYVFGILVPAGGIIVVPIYVSRRDDLPRSGDGDE